MNESNINIEEQVEKFFSENNKLIVDIPDKSDFMISFNKPTEAVPDIFDKKLLALSVGNNKKAYYNYLIENPSLCKHRIPEILKENNNDYTRHLLAISIFGNSLELFTKIIKNMGMSFLDKFYSSDKVSKKLIDYLNELSKKVFLRPIYTGTHSGYCIPKSWLYNSDITKMSFLPAKPELFAGLSSATAFAANQNQVFFGITGGFILYMSLSNGNNTRVNIYHYYNIQDSLYSLVWLRDRLYVFAEREYYVNGTKNNLTNDLRPPLCTDGKYIYCVGNMTHKAIKLAVFKFDASTQQFVIVYRKGLMKLPIKIDDEFKVSFVTDGIRMTFSIPYKNRSRIVEYSLQTGKIIHEMEEPIAIIGWCIRPYSPDHIILENSSDKEVYVKIIKSAIQTPRWMLGLEFVSTNNKSLKEDLIATIYHGVDLFTDSDIGCVTDLLTYFYDKSDIEGLYLASNFLLKASREGDFERAVNIIANFYESVEVEAVKKFCVYTLLALAHNLKSPEILSNINIFENFLLEYSDYDLVILFSCYFDWKNIELSSATTEKLFVFLSDKLRHLFQEILVLIKNCVTNFMSENINKVRFFEHTIVSMCRIISSRFDKNYYKILSGKDIEQSIIDVWKCILILINKLTPLISIHYKRLLEALLTLVFQPPNSDQDIEFNLCLTIHLLVEFLYLSPTIKRYKSFSTLDEFYDVSRCAMDIIKPEINEIIFNILSNECDIKSHIEYINAFREMQLFFLHNKEDSKKICDVLLGKTFSYRLLKQFFVYKEYRFLETVEIDGNSEIYNCVFDHLAKVLTDSTSQKIMVMFGEKFVLLNQREQELDKVKSDILSRFVASFNCLYCTPPFILKKLGIKIPSSVILMIPDNIFLKMHKSIYLTFKYVDNKDIFIKEFIKKSQTNTSFPSSQLCIENLKVTMLCYYSVDYKTTNNMSIGNISEVLNSIFEFLKVSDLETIKYLMKIVKQSDDGSEQFCIFFRHIIKIIYDYFMNSINYFVLNDDPNTSIQAVFLIIQFLKEIFCSQKSKFSIVLEELIKTKSEYTPIVYIILNNSFDILRKGVLIHIYDNNNSKISGTVKSYSDNTVEIDTKPGEKIKLSDIQAYWCICPVCININIIKNLAIYYELFSSERTYSPLIETFRVSSLAEFLKNDNFYKLCSKAFLDKMLNVEWKYTIRPEIYMKRFFYAVVLSALDVPEVSFTNLETDENEKPRFQFRQYGDTNESKPPSEGTLLTTNEKKTEYVSSPFHPRTRFTLIFDVYGTKKNNILSLTVYGFCKYCNIFVRGKAVDVGGSEQSRIIFDYDPVEQMYKIIVDDEVRQQGIFPPAVVFLYCTLSMYSSVVVDYTFICDNKIYSREVNRRDEATDIKVTTEVSVYPRSDSSQYISAELICASHCIIQSLKCLIALNILMRRKETPPPESFFSIMCSISPLFVSFVDYGNMTLRKLKDENETELFDYLKDKHPTTKELVRYILEDVKNYEDICYGNLNTEAIFIPHGKRSLIAENMFYIDEEVFSIVGYSTRISCNKKSYILPLSNVFDTIIYDIHCLSVLLSFLIYKGYKLDGLKKLFDALKSENFRYLHNALFPIESLYDLNIVQNSLPVNKMLAFFPHSKAMSETYKTLIQQLFKNKYNNVNTESIKNEIKEWRPHHSHELLASFTSLTKEGYMSHPLATRFSFQTAYLFYDILINQDERYVFLYHIRRHQIYANQFYGIIKLDSDNQEHEMYYLTQHDMNNQEEFCKSLSDLFDLPPIRLQYLKTVGLSVYSPTDCDSARIVCEIDSYFVNEKLKQYRKSFIKSIFYTKKSKKYIKWLKSYVNISSTHVILLINQYFTGNWGLPTLDQPKYLLVIKDHENNPLYMDHCADYSIIMLGEFKSEESFREVLMRNVQNYIDNFFFKVLNDS